MANIAPHRPCRTPGCDNTVPTRDGRCERCRPRKPTSAQAGYGKRWRTWRAGFLRRNPICVLCGRLADVPDHWPRSRKQLLADGVHNPDQDRYCRPLCFHDHATQTAINQPGGWALEVQ